MPSEAHIESTYKYGSKNDWRTFNNFLLLRSLHSAYQMFVSTTLIAVTTMTETLLGFANWAIVTVQANTAPSTTVATV